MPSSDLTQQLFDAARSAEDVFDLQNHIGWTDTLKPRLLKTREQLSKALVNHLLGSSLPEGRTKEQVAGQIYGIDYVIQIFENVLTRGKEAFEVLNSNGISL